MSLIYSYSKEELSAILKPDFRVKQIYGWLYKKYAKSFDEMRNLPKAMQEQLANTCTIDEMSIVQKEASQDGSVKYLFKLKDNHTVETVLLKMKEKQVDDEGKITASDQYTVCVSSQVGCKMGCTFCFTAKGGFIRNLSAGEIVYQIVALKREAQISDKKSVNVVFMGMGEPLDNLDNVSRAIEIFKDKDGLNLSPKRLTVSTSGLSEKIEKLAKMDLGINIALSLHAVDDVIRTKLMPVNKAYNIESVLKAIKTFPVNIRKKIMFEYLVIKDLNDDLKSAGKLVKLLNGFNAKVNLILFNPHEGSLFGRPDIQDVVLFRDFLNQKGLLCTIRESKGLDISAACGQLRQKDAVSKNYVSKKAHLAK